MFGKKNAITVCVDMDYSIDVQHVIDNYIKTIGMHHVYIDNNKIYIGFTTRSTIYDVEKVLQSELYKIKTTIVGGTIFVKFY